MTFWTLLALSVAGVACATDDTNDDDAVVINSNTSEGTTVRAVIEGGGSLDLEHGLTEALVVAQYVEDGIIHPITDYVGLHSPTIPNSVRKNFTSDDLNDIRGELLSNDNFLLYRTSSYGIFEADGTEVVAFGDNTDLIDDNAGNVSAAALPNGGFVLSYFVNDSTNVIVRCFDNDGMEIGFDDGNVDYLEFADVESYFTVTASSTGLAVFYKTTVESEPTAHIEYFDLNGDSVGTAFETVALDMNGPIKISALADNLVVGVYKANIEETDDQETIAVVVDPDGNEIARHVLSGSYIGNPPSFARAENGNVLVVYELGGPDVAAYAVLAGDGSILAGPTTLVGYENDDIVAGVFGDGSFVIVVVENGSSSGLMWNVKNNGQLVHNDPISFGNGFEPDDSMAIFPTGTHQVTMVYDVYSNPNSYMVDVSKNYLELEEVSDTLVRVNNYSANSVEVIIGAYGN